MLSGRGTTHKNETSSARMSIRPKNDIVAKVDDPGNTRAAHAESNSPQNNGAAVAVIGDPGSGNGKTGIADPGYNSCKIYVAGEIHPDIRVPFREIDLAPTKTMSGEIEVNEPVRVYDTSGPWSDPAFTGNIEEGLPLVRAKWIHDRGDVEEIVGRIVQP